MSKKFLLIALILAVTTPICSNLSVGSDMSILPGSLRGVVLWPDGRTPVDDMRIRVWDAKNERTVFKTRTNNDGVFHLPEFTEGELFLTAGPVQIDLTVLEPQAGIVTQPHAVVIILPKVMPFIPRIVPGATVPILIPKSP